MLLAVMERRLGIECSKFDAYINIAGGLKISEPSIDLAVLLALVSSTGIFLFRRIPWSLVEVGLSGEIRGVSHSEARIEEAIRLGFKGFSYRLIMRPHREKRDISLIPVKNIREALTIFKK